MKPPSPEVEYDYPVELLHTARRPPRTYARLLQYYTTPAARLSLNDDKPASVLPLAALATAVIAGGLLSYGIDCALEAPPDFANRTLDDFKALLAFAATRANAARWLSLPGTLFVRALNCLVVPLIFVNLAMGVAELVQAGKLGRVTWRMLALFVLTTMLAAGQGLFWTSLVPEDVLRTRQTNVHANDTRWNRAAAVDVRCPDNSTFLSWTDGALTCNAAPTSFQLTDTSRVFTTMRASRQAAKKSIPDLLELIATLIVPNNVFQAFVDGDVLSIVAFVLPFGLAIARSGATTGHNPMWALCQQLSSILTIMVSWVVAVMPVAVLFMVAATLVYPEDSHAAPMGWNLAPMRGNGRGANASSLPFEQTLARSEYFFDNLAAEPASMPVFLALFVVGWLAHFVLVLPALTLLTTSHNPLPYLRSLAPALWFGFLSSSALAAMPLLMKVMHLSEYVSRQVTRFVIPVGTGIHMDGIALYVSTAMVFLLRTQSYDRAAPVPEAFALDTGMYLLIWVCATIAAWTVPPLPHSGVLGLLFVWFAIVGESRPTNLHWMIAMDVVTDRLATVGTMLSNAVVTFIVAEKVDERYADEQDRRHRTLASRHEWLSE
ncbi:dicarboxylate/amino acid:cation (Na or H) symporter (DAACS) family protein [Achlya hypogyna]|uniref:Amino acid transporter n=1 Tax=Achlya hypogyna TaxID=1202772 RepID=A0A1V9Z0Q7_ACHHY|nr:dicarboxylate/amino acid:cation (Na or H) symporter (DAACS) family protein [Achlya hypogyna]